MKLSKVVFLEEPLNPRNYVGKFIQTLDGRFFLVVKRDSKYSLIPCDMEHWIDLTDEELALAVFNNKNGEAIAFYQEPIEEEPEDDEEYEEIDLDEL